MFIFHQNHSKRYTIASVIQLQPAAHTHWAVEGDGDGGCSMATMNPDLAVVLTGGLPTNLQKAEAQEKGHASLVSPSLTDWLTM